VEDLIIGRRFVENADEERKNADLMMHPGVSEAKQFLCKFWL